MVNEFAPMLANPVLMLFSITLMAVIIPTSDMIPNAIISMVSADRSFVEVIDRIEIRNVSLIRAAYFTTLKLG